MTSENHKIPPPGRGTIHGYLFLIFFHLLPVPWYLAVVGGLAPASFLFAGGMVSLFLPDLDSLAFAALLLAPALIGGLVLYMTAWLFALGIVKKARAWVRTGILAAIGGSCLAASMFPIFIYGGHSRASQFSLFDFIGVLAEANVPRAISIPYYCALSLLLIGLLFYQHRVAGQPPISLRAWQKRRRFKRWMAAGCLLSLIVALGWTHRILLVVKPLAEMGAASAQYRLAMAIKGHSARTFRTNVGFREWLVRAAEQGHGEAAWQLLLHPLSKAEEHRWLAVAAQGGKAEAQYRVYRILLKADPWDDFPGSAREWLEKAAFQGHAGAQFDLAEHYHKGHDGLKIAQDFSKARHWWEQAATNGHGNAMEALAWRYETGADGFTHDPQRAIALFNQIAEAYQHGRNGLPQYTQLATGRRAQAERIKAFEKRLAAQDPQAQAELGRKLLRVVRAAPQTIAEGVKWLENAARQGDSQVQYELGGIFLFGRHGVAIDLPRGRQWWAKALAQNHIKTMEYVAPAYQNGRFGYPVDLLKSKAVVERLVAAYAEGRYGVETDPHKARYWRDQFKYFDRLFELAGGTYQSPEELQQKAGAGDAASQYQLGRQMMISGPPEFPQQGLRWIERAAEGGHAEAQYRLVTYYERQMGIMANDPQRGVGFLAAAAEQNHLRAMGALALGYQKGRYGLDRDYRQAQAWYRRLLQAYETGTYLGEIDERFIPFQRRQLKYAAKALHTEIEKQLRYKVAAPQERLVIEIEERYRLKFQQAVNAMDRRDGSPVGQRRIRAEIENLRQEFTRLRQAEIARITDG